MTTLHYKTKTHTPAILKPYQNTLARLIFTILLIIAQHPQILHASNAGTELQRLQSKLPGLHIIQLKDTPQNLTLTKDQSITIDDLRGLELDDTPPAPIAPPHDLRPDSTDNLPQPNAPYRAKNIRPFRLNYFDCVLDYGGRHNLAMIDYAASHGFNVVKDTHRKPHQRTRLPKGTRFIHALPGVKWNKLVPSQPIPLERLDLFTTQAANHDLIALASKHNYFNGANKYDLKMIDIEHTCLPPEKLRKQPWYPYDADKPAQIKFEQQYYDGYAQSYTIQIQAARRKRWKTIGTYGWQPIERSWDRINQLDPNLQTNWRWNAYGRAIYQNVDVLFPSLYCFYWSPKNVAYTLALSDLTQQAIKTLKTKKPILPYYWSLLHGGSNQPRWWQHTPMPQEDLHAMIALGFFTGQDGFVLWGWSAQTNHHLPPPWLTGDQKAIQRLKLPTYLPVINLRTTVHAPPKQKNTPYDVIDVVGLNPKTNTVRFRFVDMNSRRTGVAHKPPVHKIPAATLAQHVRVPSASLTAAVEALALIKPFEQILKNGQPHIDSPATTQFTHTLPIVRRVTHGNTHLIATYDPIAIHDTTQKPRQITIDNFNNTPGLTLTLPADKHTRLFILQQPQ